MAGVKGKSGGGFDKPFREAIMLAVNRTAKDGKIKRLHIIAENLVKAACKNDMTAIKEVIDRCDGRPVMWGDQPPQTHNVLVNFSINGRPLGNSGHMESPEALPEAGSGDLLQ